MQMFERLAQRIEQRAGAAVENAIDRVTRAVADFPGVRVNREAGRIVMSGRRLSRRWLDDVRLRFAVRGRR